MLRAVRIGYVLLAWAFVAGLVGQVFLMGIYLFGGEIQARELHLALGWALHLAPLPLLLLAALARAGRAHWQWALALTAVVLVVPVLATMREVPLLAALHPVGAMVAFALAVVVAWKSLAVLRVERAPTAPPSEMAAP